MLTLGLARRCSGRLPLGSRLRFGWNGRAYIGPPARASTSYNGSQYLRRGARHATFRRPVVRSCCTGSDKIPSPCLVAQSKAPNLRRTRCSRPVVGKAATRVTPAQLKFACGGRAPLHGTPCLHYLSSTDFRSRKCSRTRDLDANHPAFPDCKTLKPLSHEKLQRAISRVLLLSNDQTSPAVSSTFGRCKFDTHRESADEILRAPPGSSSTIP